MIVYPRFCAGCWISFVRASAVVSVYTLPPVFVIRTGSVLPLPSIRNVAVASGFESLTENGVVVLFQRTSPLALRSPVSILRIYDESARTDHAFACVVDQWPLLRREKSSVASSSMRGE